jgi:hypothetical protein
MVSYNKDEQILRVKNTVLWDVTPCSLIGTYRFFGRACSLNIHNVYSEDKRQYFSRQHR